MAEQERMTAVPITPGIPLVVKVDRNLEKEINIEKDAETSMKVMKTTAEAGAKPEKVKQYNKYVLSGKGGSPEQKVNEAVNDINYHNMIVVITIGEKPLTMLEVYVQWQKSGGYPSV